MVEKIVIRDNKKSPVTYISKIPIFKNGKVFEFKPGVNVIVGKNGCGKTTLMKIIESYLLVGKNECSKGMFNSNIRDLFGLRGTFIDGIDVYSDYQKNVFRMCHAAEKNDDDNMSDFEAFSEFFTQIKSSAGEFKKGQVESPEMKAKRSASLKASWDRRKKQEKFRKDYNINNN